MNKVIDKLKPISEEEKKKVLVGIMEAIDDYCKKNGIMYYLAYGSLLGAVRHKGFIPWDDDMDIIMERKEYDRFIAGFNEGRNDNYKLLTFENNKDYYLLTAKVCDTRTILIEDVPNPIEIGVFIDIFVNDYLTDSLIEAKKTTKKIRKQYKLISSDNIADRKDRVLYKKLILKMLRLFIKIINRRRVLGKINKLAKTHINMPNSKYIGSIASYAYGEREICESKWWTDGFIELPFEGKLFMAPKNYDDILKHFYGDYMTPPPIEEQKTHHANRAYWRS